MREATSYRRRAREQPLFVLPYRTAIVAYRILRLDICTVTNVQMSQSNIAFKSTRFGNVFYSSRREYATSSSVASRFAIAHGRNEFIRIRVFIRVRVSMCARVYVIIRRIGISFVCRWTILSLLNLQLVQFRSSRLYLLRDNRVNVLNNLCENSLYANGRYNGSLRLLIVTAGLTIRRIRRHIRHWNRFHVILETPYPLPPPPAYSIRTSDYFPSFGASYLSLTFIRLDIFSFLLNKLWYLQIDKKLLESSICICNLQSPIPPR